MPAGLNSSELSGFAPAWVPEPNGRGVSRISQSGEVVQPIQLAISAHNGVVAARPFNERFFQARLELIRYRRSQY